MATGHCPYVRRCRSAVTPTVTGPDMRTPTRLRTFMPHTPSALTEGTPGGRDRRGGRNAFSVV